MRKRNRFDDFDFNGVKKRRVRGLEGWRTLLEVRSGDLLRILRSPPVALPLLAGFLVLGLSLINQRYYHQQAIDFVAQEAQLAATVMDAYVAAMSERVDAAAAKLAEDKSLSPQSLLPEARLAQVVPLTPLGIADESNQPLEALSYIERDMIRRSLEQDTPLLDVYRDGKEWVFSVVKPVAEDGVLLVTYPERVFGPGLAQASSDKPILVELRYKAVNNWESIARRGAVEPSPAAMQVPMELPLWAVKVTLGDFAYQRQVANTLWLFVVALIAAVAALIELVLGLVSMRQRRQALRLSMAQAAAEQARQDSLEEDLIEAVFDASKAGAMQGSEPADGADPDSRGDSPPAKSDPEDDFLDVFGASAKLPEPRTASANQAHIDDAIFRAYDIRGVADEQLTTSVCRDIGRALGSELVERQQRCTLVARDGRNSSPRIRDALVEGIRACGVDVVDLGTVPTPVMHFATHEFGIPNGFMVTGSHNEGKCNGVKMVMQGESLTEERIHALRDRIHEQRFVSADTPGGYSHRNAADGYIKRVVGDVVVARRLKIVVDAANGVTAPIAPRLFQDLGCAVEPLFCELNGDFPNHDPDPTQPANLHALQAAVRAKRADLGIAFDGDGDRVVFVTSTGEVVFPDQALMVLAQDVVSRNPGAAVVYDVKCSNHLPRLISDAGGLPIMCRSGHSFVKNQLEISGALLGGEFTGHIFMRERWYGFDDGMYVAARMLEFLSLSPMRLHEHIGRLPVSVSTPELSIASDEAQKFVIVEQLKLGDYFADAELNTLDGLRVSYPDGWGLVRASNTGAALSLRFEADTQERLREIQEQFKRALSDVDPTLSFDF